MNAIVKSTSCYVITPKTFIEYCKSKASFGLFALCAAIVMTALCSVYVTNESRQMYSQLSYEQQRTSELTIQHSQLLLEQSTRDAEARVAAQASANFGMVVPHHKKIIVIND